MVCSCSMQQDSNGNIIRVVNSMVNGKCFKSFLILFTVSFQKTWQITKLNFFFGIYLILTLTRREK